MEYRTVVGVEIATVGMDWHASTGDFTCTFEHLADAATAANDDPLIQTPRLKLGHASEVNGELRVVNPFADLGDAEPAFGRVVNLRLASAGAKLLGDFIEVPVWLADALPSAYPSRSMEAQLRVTTEGNKTYSAVITALALLGPVIPAIKCLADLERFLIEGPTDDVSAASQTPEEGRMPQQVDASVSSATVRERFNWDWAESNPVDGLDTFYWWACDVRLDPDEVIALSPDGDKYSVPFTTDGKDEITFGEPVQVREEFVPVNASAGAVAQAVRLRTGQRVLASNLERPEKPAPKTAASAQPDPQEDEMDIDLDKLRDRLGLPDDATEEQINEALAAEPETPETPEVEETPEPIAASHGATVDKAALAQLQADAKAGREARAAQLKAEDDSLLAECTGKGRIAPAVEASYRDQLNKGGEIRAATRKFLEGLPDNTIPVEEIGVAAESDEGQVARVMAAVRGHKQAA